ncbi:MAG: hypothetical protein H6R06_3248 [Proteobacteria bacterium]|nr:hypothetical protein [Pseudomonadota bacterium]
MTVRRLARSRLLSGVASALLVGCLALGSATQAQTPSSPQSAANASGPTWTALTPAQQSALAPLRKDWQTIDAPRKQKWLEIAARLPSLQPEERKRIQDRMTEWARMTPDERGRARLQFQEARQISPQERQARWDAYLALPADERRALANSAKSVPKAGSASARTPADGSTKAAAMASVQKNNIVTAPSPAAAAKTVTPTVVQAKPGASTTLISKTASPPPHAQVGQPKIAVGQDKVNRSTLLPKAGPQSATAAASAAQ